MRGKLIDFSLGLNRKQRITIELDADFRNDYDELKDNDIEVTIKRYRKKRSLDANAYAWVLLGKLSEAVRTPTIDLYKRYVKSIGGTYEIVCAKDCAVETLVKGWEHQGIGWQAETLPSKIEGCTNVMLFYGSSLFDSAQMAQLIEMIVEDCKEMGIETLTPDEIRKLKGLEHE